MLQAGTRGNTGKCFKSREGRKSKDKHDRQEQIRNAGTEGKTDTKSRDRKKGIDGQKGRVLERQGRKERQTQIRKRY